VVSICSTNFNSKFLHFASIVYVSVLYASHDRESAVSLGGNHRWVFLLETELVLSCEELNLLHIVRISFSRRRSKWHCSWLYRGQLPTWQKCMVIWQETELFVLRTAMYGASPLVFQRSRRLNSHRPCWNSMQCGSVLHPDSR
jgi:hypothetical protein